VAQTPNTADVKQNIAHERKSFNEKSKIMSELTGAQIRAARALLRWTAEDLAESASVGLSTIRRAEAEDGPPSITAANLKLIQMTLENAGIEFITRNGGGVGVRFKESK
jgi:ribosome-binding protein aMBF1 (putative translation factor)